MAFADLSNPVVPEFDLTFDGRSLVAEARPFIVSILVDDSIAWPSMFAIQFVSSFDLDNVHQWIDDSAVEVGGIVEVKLGYGNDLETLITGEITGLEPEYVVDRLPSVIVRGYDRRHRLQRGRKTRTFLAQKDSDIAAQVAKEADLGADAEDSKVIHDYVMQANQTDLEFLQARAARIQYEVVVTNKTLHFRPVKNNQSEVMTLVIGEHLLEFYPRLSMGQQIGTVNVRGWNPQEKKRILSAVEAGFESAGMGGSKSGPQLNEAFGQMKDILTMQPAMTQAEADQVAKAALSQKAMSLIEGEGVCLGRTDLRSGKVIKITDLGRRFSGQYYVTNAIHRYTAQGGYRTQFQVRRNAS
jgi:phage protein D